MDLQLANKTALVTGSTAGIGYAIAEELAREGATVIVNGRTRARVESAVQMIRVATRRQALELAADMGTVEGTELAIQRFPHVDILVNNLGIFEPKAFEQIPDSDWFHIFEVNVLSGVRLSRHYLPRMKANGWGRIVFVSSESGVQIPADFNVQMNNIDTMWIKWAQSGQNGFDNPDHLLQTIKSSLASALELDRAEALTPRSAAPGA